MPILRVTPRKQALLDRARKRRQLDWKHNPANPEMLVYTRFLLQNNTTGVLEKVETELPPAAMSSLATESLSYAEGDFSKPNWNHDPLYYAAKRLRRIRRQRTP